MFSIRVGFPKGVRVGEEDVVVTVVSKSRNPPKDFKRMVDLAYKLAEISSDKEEAKGGGDEKTG